MLVTPDAPTVGELAELGVSRISVGGAIAVAAYGAAVKAAATELREQGTARLLGSGQAGGRASRRSPESYRRPPTP